MPELPEVETVKNDLKEMNIINKSIIDIVIKNSKLREPLNFEQLKKMKNQRITNIYRKGKYLIFQLSDFGYCIIHLGMTGKVLLKANDYTPSKHDHFFIYLDDKIIVYNDPRKFGFVLFEEDLDSNKYLSNVGYEPFSDDYLNNPDLMYELYHKRKVPIKTLLMNGKLIVGIGNIYANEALFLSKIHPKTLGINISKDNYQILQKNVFYILKKSIEFRGTTLSDYRDSYDNKGNNQNLLQIYNKTNCPACNTELSLIKINGRTSYYCPKCQIY